MRGGEIFWGEVVTQGGARKASLALGYRLYPRWGMSPP